MSIASRIQEMETHIGNAYTSIDNLGIDISNTNKNIYNISTLLDTFYESLPKVSGIGSFLSLSPTMVGKIKLNEIQGDTLQNGTPTPSSPVPIQSVTGLQNVEVCGKNLLDMSTLQYGYVGSNGTIVNTHTAGEMYSSFIKVEPNTTYTFKIFETSTTYNNWFVVGEYSTKDQNSFIIRDTMTTATQDYITFTTTATTQYVRVSARNLENATKVQLEQNNQATTYESYNGNTYEVNLGKNLLPNLVTTQTKNGVEITKNSDGSLTFNNTATAGINLNINYASGSYIHLESGKKYTISITNNSGIYFRLAKVSDGTLVALFDTPTNQTTFTSSYTGDVFAYLTILNGTSFSNLTIYPQIEVGSQATSYSPYFTPIELNKIGTYEDSIKKSTGKNLFDKDNANVLNGNLADGGTLSSTNNARTLYIPCKNNTTYTITKAQAVYFRVAQFTNIPAIGDSYISRTKNDTANSITFTTTTGNYLAVTYWYNTSTNTEQQVLDSLMINEGSTALPYEPYGKVWYITKNIGKVDFSTISWSSAGHQASNYRRYYTNTIPNVKYVSANTQLGVGLCEKYKIHTGQGMGSYGAENCFAIDVSIVQAVDQTTPSGLFYYALNTPIYTEITNTELIEQLETLYNAKSKNGTTNINVTSEDLSMILNVNVIKGDA